ncbi:MAG: ATP-binding cassette domain-containing protein [Firmicutes bacterium]|nr:ATP-binding cassette domain-containing protein [Bacillota bacterium]MCL2770869.1 ATP-binding cassette domain-containing protein [Bacillota bacterium]
MAENQTKKEALIVDSLWKTYTKGKNWSNTNISFNLKEGEVVGFLGNNGAGKTTCLKAITGIHTFERGSIQICGYDTLLEPLKAKVNFGYVPDNHVTFEKLTGREYVNFSADIYGVSTEDREKRIRHYLDLLKIEFAFDRQIKSYSHGMKQKIAIMASFIHNPKLWILDEPLVGLDVHSQREVLAILQDAKANGNCVFFSSHSLDVVQRICDRVVIIHDGVKIKEIDIHEFNKTSKITLEEEFATMVNAKDKAKATAAAKVAKEKATVDQARDTAIAEATAKIKEATDKKIATEKEILENKKVKLAELKAQEAEEVAKLTQKLEELRVVEKEATQAATLKAQEIRAKQAAKIEQAIEGFKAKYAETEEGRAQLAATEARAKQEAKIAKTRETYQARNKEAVYGFAKQIEAANAAYLEVKTANDAVIANIKTEISNEKTKTRQEYLEKKAATKAELKAAKIAEKAKKAEYKKELKIKIAAEKEKQAAERAKIAAEQAKVRAEAQAKANAEREKLAKEKAEAQAKLNAEKAKAREEAEKAKAEAIAKANAEKEKARLEKEKAREEKNKKSDSEV